MEQRARLGDVELAYEVAGDGPPLVWCHGLASCRDGDRDVIDALSERFTVLSWDARGHGRSSPVRDASSFSYAKLADDAIAMLDHIG
ncbi:MAG: alpha/beta fold hydrolase, partial [Actinomycetota bacterium]